MILKIGIAAASLWVTGAAAAPVRYVCNDGTTLAVTFSEPNAAHGTAELVFAQGDRRMRLPQALSADGGRYADGATEFWVKGERATLTRDGSPLDCRTAGQ